MWLPDRSINGWNRKQRQWASMEDVEEQQQKDGANFEQNKHKRQKYNKPFYCPIWRSLVTANHRFSSFFPLPLRWSSSALHYLLQQQSKQQQRGQLKTTYAGIERKKLSKHTVTLRRKNNEDEVPTQTTTTTTATKTTNDNKLGKKMFLA